MCGICGILSKETAPLAPLITAMNQVQHLRGPDDSGTCAVTAAGFACTLGHSRLAILDRATGQQPMTLPGSGISLVCNGEIYNHLQLRSDLEKSGCIFRSRSDSEVLLHGYQVWGLDELLRRIDGMFAFAIADPLSKLLILARDPAGQKPLYYTNTGDQLPFAFASTLEALGALPWFEQEIDREAVELFLNLRVIPPPYSIYRTARKLPPGSYLVHDGTTATVKEYWSPLSFPLTSDARNEQALLDEYHSILASSLAETLVADEPVSLMLSSGIDSASLACELAKLPAKEAVTAFTVAFPGQRFDESASAAAIAQQLELNHRILPFGDDPFGQIATLGRISDEPFGDPGMLPSLQLAQAVSANSRVAITGDGADELFGGYPTFAILPLWPALRRLPPFTGHAGQILQRLLPFPEAPHSLAMKVQRFCQGLGKPDHLAFAHWLCIFSPTDTALLMGQRASGHFEAFVTDRLKGMPDADATTVMCRTYFRLFLPGVLEKTDRAAMHYSLETRAPFLQRRMIEFGLALPPRFKVRGGKTKYLMRKALANCLPGSVPQAPKRGFLPPLAQMFAGTWGADATEILREACDSFGLDPVQILGLLGEHRRRQYDHSQKLWLIYQLGIFQRHREAAGQRNDVSLTQE